MQELRTTRRTARIDCQVVRLSDFSLVADRIENASESGVLVGPADPVLTGEPIIVSFRLPGFADWIDAEGVVARVAHGRRPGESRRSLGLELHALDPRSARLWHLLLGRLPPAPPTYRVTFRRADLLAARFVARRAGS
jgi:hypothetical protein